MLNLLLSQGFSSGAPIDSSKLRDVFSDAVPSVSCPAAGPAAGYATAESVIPDLLHEAIATESQIREVSALEEKWLPKHQRRFLELVRAQSLSKISPKEKTELNRLQALRRALHHPRTPDEIVLEYRRRTAMQNLTDAMEQYVIAYAIED